MKIDLSLNNDTLYAGCEIEEVAGRLNLKTPVAEAVNTVGRCGTNAPFALRWERPEGTHQIGFYDQRGKAANKPTLGKREANATPLEFRDELLRLAMMEHNAELTSPPTMGFDNKPDYGGGSG